MEDGPAGGNLPREASTEEAEPLGATWSGDSGHVSQPGRPLPLLRRAALGYASSLLPATGPRPEVEALDASLEDLLARVDEFVGMLDMIRGDSSHVVSEGVPRIHAKAAEMRRIYGRIDKLEAFVRMIGCSVARMEEQVTKAEAELGTFPRAFRRLLHTISVPALFRSAPSGPQRSAYEPPVLFRTEDHFPGCDDRQQL
ncbi:LOW QUALITY PROTEIN: biogenesis of lysosome-related organelles complex 1 subunit 4 [Cricetulus griseus]|uniref:LOW QUALITY PROTEIN: biogenesis of lysosome-related organelles complex 1 subunit 4 n=1 Tax=Cricetulus griseus TaxID=10029 RepID=UPI000F73DCCF|nr:LOW QUALITY PROTEIN: biogenesis of lysosome-related organelles complex 1 subunit 4 [Cricetulus griseus]